MLGGGEIWQTRRPVSTVVITRKRTLEVRILPLQPFVYWGVTQW